MRISDCRHSVPALILRFQQVPKPAQNEVVIFLLTRISCESPPVLYDHGWLEMMHEIVEPKAKSKWQFYSDKKSGGTFPRQLGRALFK